jgi:hypothetical protein
VQLPARPGGAQVAPPGGGGGNTPAASGAGSPLPGVRGPGARSFSAPQVASAASAAYTTMLLLSTTNANDALLFSAFSTTLLKKVGEKA